MKIRFTIFEIIIGVIAMITGLVLTVLVWDDGYFVGALMLVVAVLLPILILHIVGLKCGSKMFWRK
jgi:hypothetical protein